MNLSRYIILQILICGSLPAWSQASLDSLLSKVLQNNLSIMGAGQYYENTRIASRTNLYPENPELEYAYLWGSPAAQDNRTDFGLSQSFDFPGVYTKRSKMSKAGIVKAGKVAESVRQNTLLQAKRLWIEKVYLNRKHQSLANRMEEAGQVSMYFRKQFETGEISKLRYNKALLQEASLRSEIDLLEAESLALDAGIARISGDPAYDIEDLDYYPIDYAILDSVLKSSLTDPLYLAFQQEVEVLSLQKQLTRASGMPKFKTGYYSETVPGLKMQGIRLGITIPLWENAGKVKAASGEIISAELAVEKFRSDEVTSILQLHARYRSYQKQIRDLSLALEISNDPGLLSIAVESGEISMVEYFYETDLYYRVLSELLYAEKELQLAEAELSKYEL